MGLIDRIFKGGKEKVREAAPTQASTQFYESEPDSEEPQAERNAPRRELVQVVLRDTMRKHGIPSDWVECRMLSSISRSGRRGLHVNFVVRHAHDRLLPYVFAFQDSFERELARFEPRCRDWLLSLGWEFVGVDAAAMPEARTGMQPLRAPEAAAGAPAPATAGALAGAATGAATPPAAAAAGKPGPAPEPASPEAARSDDEIQRDLQALFAIRDAALADAARKPAGDSGHPDFEPTQPFDDDEPPRR